MVSMKTREENKNKCVSKIRVIEELTNGRRVPIYEPVSVNTKIKARKFSSVVNKYSSLKDLIEYLEQGYRVVRFKAIKEKITSVEEKLLCATHKLVVIKLKDGSEKEFLVPTDKSASFRQLSFKYIKLNEHHFYKCVSDANSMMLLKFKYTISGDHNMVHFTVYNIDNYTMKIRKHQETAILDSTDSFKFDIRKKCESLCIVWPFQSQASVLNFTAPSLKFLHFPIEEDLSGAFYRVDIFSEYLTVTILDSDFEDSVFSVKDVSKRLRSYYLLHTGQRFDSKKALTDLTELTYFEHPTDVIYLNIPEAPVWLTLEWLLPETTLLKLVFGGISDGFVSHLVKEIDFSELFTEYKTFFGSRTNEDQYNYEYCPMTSQLFLWTSKRHIIIINMKTYEIEALLELKTEKYFDFKDDNYQFVMGVSRDGKQIDVFVKKGKDIHHFEQFLVPSLKTLKLKAMSAVTAVYSKPVIGNLKIQPSLKNELLISY